MPKIFRCRSCNSKRLETILDLGNQPWCNDFLELERVGNERIYPLNLVYCNDCSLLQLDFTVPKEIMFKQHDYVSSTTKTLRKHFGDLALENKEQFNLQPDDLIVDIGGNDGTQLEEYGKLGFNNLLNIESATNIAALSNVPTVNEFFNEKTAKNLFKKGEVKLFNASGVFFHLEELHSVIRGIEYALSDDGVFIVQFMYAGTMIEKLNFDGIYHEHLCYYTLSSLEELLSPYGLMVSDAYYSNIHSGSVIAKVIKVDKDFGSVNKRTKELSILDETYTKERFKEFAHKVKENREKFVEFIYDLHKQNPKVKIYAYGAPAKGNTLLNYYALTNKDIQKCVEVNGLKIGKFLPGSHIPIVKESKEDLPDYYLLLSHNFEDEIMEKNKDIIEKGVKFILPFPEIKVIP